MPLTRPLLFFPPRLQEWAKDVLRHYNKYKNEDKRKYAEMDAEEIQSKFVEAVHDHPLYGTNFFHVRRHKFPEQVRWERHTGAGAGAAAGCRHERCCFSAGSPRPRSM